MFLEKTDHGPNPGSLLMWMDNLYSNCVCGLRHYISLQESGQEAKAKASGANMVR